MRRAGAAAYRATGAEQGLVHDLADRTRATAALGAAAETAIDLTGGARRGRGHGGAHFVVGQDVAGADDHRKTRQSDGSAIWLPARRLRVKAIRSLKWF
jgi:hypothetical protein